MPASTIGVGGGDDRSLVECLAAFLPQKCAIFGRLKKDKTIVRHGETIRVDRWE
jgi:hypothetical protein